MMTGTVNASSFPGSKSTPRGRQRPLHDGARPAEQGRFLAHFFGSPSTANGISPSQSSEDLREAAEREVGSITAPAPASSSSAKLGISSVLEELPDGLARTSSNEDVDIKLLRTLLQAYFALTRKSMQDLIPKTIMHLLVKHVRDALQNRLVGELYRESRFEELLKEDEAVKSERSRCDSLLHSYKAALQVMQDIT